MFDGTMSQRPDFEEALEKLVEAYGDLPYPTLLRALSLMAAAVSAAAEQEEKDQK